MTHDPSNPFHKLAKSFAQQQRPNKKAGTGDARAAGARVSGPGKASGQKTGPGLVPEEEEDAALFFQAMSAVRPMDNAGRGPDELLPGPRSGKKRSSKKPPQDASFLYNGRADGRKGTPEANASRELLPNSKQHSQPAGAPDHNNKGRNSSAPEQDANASPDIVARQGSLPSGSSLSALKRVFSGNDRQSPPENKNEEETLFAKAMQGVNPVTTRGRDVPAQKGMARGTPAVDPAKALRDLLEGRVEFAMHHTDEFMEGYVVGIDPLVMTRLRSGQFSPEAHLDMHGQNAIQALDSLTWFIKNAYQRGLRTVLVVTGRGKNSPDGVGVLRALLQRWLPKEPFKRVVLAFCTAKASDGGPGAVYVLLRKYKKSRGKIIWEHGQYDNELPDL